MSAILPSRRDAMLFSGVPAAALSISILNDTKFNLL